MTTTKREILLKMVKTLAQRKRWEPVFTGISYLKNKDRQLIEELLEDTDKKTRHFDHLEGKAWKRFCSNLIAKARRLWFINN